MTSITWRELHQLIEEKVVDKNSFVNIYDMKTGDMITCDFIELKNEQVDGWEPVIAINTEEFLE